MERPKACVFIACHCAPKVLKLTLGTWLEQYDGSYDAEVHVGIHNNYSHYHPCVHELEALGPRVRLTVVPEMNWAEEHEIGSKEWMMRYSEMHTRSLLAMMRKAAARPFTHAAFLDHDLVFESDFVAWAMSRDADMVCSLFGDRDKPATMPTGIGPLVFAAKPSAWHLVVSRRLFDDMTRRNELVRPAFQCGLMYDTLAYGYEYAKMSGMEVDVVREDKMRDMVRHLWSMSFNYGPLQESDEAYNKKLVNIEAEYNMRFPNGIGALLEKLDKR